VSARYIGVDVGGTKVSCAVMCGGDLTEPVVEPTRKGSSDDLVDQIADCIEAARTPDTEAAGIGVPAAIEFATGTAKSGVNVPLVGVPLRRLLTERLGMPVFVDNDANVAALAEAHDADNRLIVSHLVMFTVGTGVGGGLVLNGRPYRGVTGAGAELGHSLIGLDLSEEIPPAGERFPQPGSIEALAAGTALDRMAAASARSHPDSVLGRALAETGVAKGPQVVAAAKEGDAECIRLLALLGGRLGIGMAGAVNAFDPEEVVIGGGVATAGNLLLEPAIAAARPRILPGVGDKTRFRLARHGVEAGVRGAALLAGQEVIEEVAA